MAEEPSDSRPLRDVPDGGALATLASGLIVLRRYKHLPIDFAAAKAKGRLAQLTDKVSGSKFLPEWTLASYLEWITARVQGLQWTSQSGSDSRDFAHLDA